MLLIEWGKGWDCVLKKHDGGIVVSEFEKMLKDYTNKVLGGSSSHDLDHTLRVVRLARKIAEEEEADSDVVVAAAYLHDIARPIERIDPKVDHAKKGAELARKVLEEFGFPKEKIEMVAQAIEDHRFRNGKVPRTLEGKVLQDADRLDAIGAIGIYRAISYSCVHGRSIDDTIKHFEEKILKLKDTLHTESAKKLAKEKHKLVKMFVDALKKELNL